MGFDPIGAIGGVVGGAARDILHDIESLPGVEAGANWISDEVKAFAKTDFGATVLRAISSSVYGGLAWGGPLLSGLAAISFAIPGLAKGDNFVDAWTNEFVWRVKTTANILTAGQGGEAVGSAVLDQVKPIMSQVDIAGQEILNRAKELGANVNVPDSIADVLAKNGITPQALAAKLGIREDMAQSALDAATRKLSFAAPEISIGGFFMPARGGATFDPKTGKQTTSPDVLKEWEGLSLTLDALVKTLPATQGAARAARQAEIAAITAQRAQLAKQSGGTLPPYPVDVSAGMLNAYMAGGAQRGDPAMLALLVRMAKDRVLTSMSGHYIDMNKQVGGSGGLG